MKEYNLKQVQSPQPAPSAPVLFGFIALQGICEPHPVLASCKTQPITARFYLTCPSQVQCMPTYAYITYESIWRFHEVSPKSSKIRPP